MTITYILSRLVAGLLPQPRLHDLPVAVLREFDAEGRHFTEQGAGTGRAPLSFRIHPISELTEYRDRLFVATFPQIGDRFG